MFDNQFMPEGFRPNIIQPEQEIPDPEQNPESLESALSPEVVEAIMAKVQDIDAKGTAFSVVRPDFRKSVLENGLLGTPLIERNSKYSINPEEWAKLARTGDAAVYFNIVGRMQEFNENEENKRKLWGTEISNSYWMGKTGLAVIFDISSFEELIPSNRAISKRPRTYRSDQDFLNWKEFSSDTPISHPDIVNGLKRNEYRDSNITKDFKTAPNSEWGFVAYHRIAPRLFKGLIFGPSRHLTPEEKEQYIREHSMEGKTFNETSELKKFTIWQSEEVVVQENNPVEIEKQIERLVSEMIVANEGKLKNLVPIYDTDGNLLWPKKMSYDEVKKFVAERDAGKTKTS